MDYKDYVEKNREQLKKDGKSDEDLERIKRMKPGLHFRKSKKPR